MYNFTKLTLNASLIFTFFWHYITALLSGFYEERSARNLPSTTIFFFFPMFTFIHFLERFFYFTPLATLLGFFNYNIKSN